MGRVWGTALTKDAIAVIRTGLNYLLMHEMKQ